jgi:ectoine hydroxylase-related dioxygenase (phytanoyl-CoA dioxygenase family)
MVDSTVERGCLQVIRGAHRNGIAKHYRNAPRKYLEILPGDLPAGEVVTVPVPLGGVLLLTNRTPHQSIPNVTDVIRWSADLRYQGAHLPNNYRATGAPVQEVREDDVPVACYPPEADFLVRSQQRPEDIVTDWEEFHRIRKTHLARPVTQRWETL